MSGSVGDRSCNSLPACIAATSVGNCVDTCEFSSCEDNTEDMFNLDSRQCSQSQPSSFKSVCDIQFIGLNVMFISGI